MLRACSHRRPLAPVVRGPQEALAALSAATDRGRTPCVVVGALTWFAPVAGTWVAAGEGRWRW